VSKLRVMNMKLHIEGASDLSPWISRNERRGAWMEAGGRVCIVRTVYTTSESVWDVRTKLFVTSHS
jgi:hypothetical protein